MCLEFGSCFGGSRKDDFGGERPNHGGCGGRRHRHRRGDNGNGASYYGGNDHKAAPAYDHQLAVDEAGRKAYHDAATKADQGTVVTDAAVRRAYDVHQAPADHPEHAAMDYQYHYPANTTTLIRY